MAKGYLTRRGITTPIGPYNENMVQFFAIPGASGKIRLKIEKPSGADGVMIRYKSSAWTSGDTKDTGTLVVAITDDLDYKGTNQWYESTGLTNGTEYYFKAFPYKGTEYNSEIGSNETLCKAGGLLAEYTMDSISGSVVNDTSGNGKNSTRSANLSVSAGVVGNQFVGNGSSSVFVAPSISKVMGVSFFNNYGTLPSVTGQYLLALNHYYYSGDLAMYPSRIIAYNQTVDAMYVGSFEVGNGGSSIKFSKSILSGTKHIAVNMPSSLSSNASNIKVFIDNSEITTTVHKNSTTNYDGVGETMVGAMNSGANTSSSRFFSSSSMDQIRLYDRNLESYEITNLYNGGAGC